MSVDGKCRLLSDANVADVSLIDLCLDLLCGEVGNAHDDSRIIRALYRHCSDGLRLADDNARDRCSDDGLVGIRVRFL